MTTQTISRERLESTIAKWESARDEVPFGLGDEDDNILAALKYALATMDSEPVAYIIQDEDARKRGEKGFLRYFADISDEDINENKITVTPLYAAPPAPVAVPVMFIDGDISSKDAEKLAKVIREFNEEDERPLAKMARIIRDNPHPTNECDMPRNAPAPVAVPDKMLCDFYEVSNWPDLVRELVKHVEQLQDAAKRNVKPWEDTFPETLLPGYIDKVKQSDEACRAAILRSDLREAVRREHAEWSQSTFGNVGPIGPLKHLAKEAMEAVADIGDLSEWADMQFLFWDAQRRAGVTDEQITQAMIDKLAVNKTRQWPEPKDGEPRLHIKPEQEV